MKVASISILILVLFLGHPTVLLSQKGDTVSFSQLLELAMENNYGIRITKSNTEIYAVNNTYGNAGFLPVVGVGAVNNNSVIDSKTVDFNDSVINRNGVNTNMVDAFVQLNWTLFDGTKMFVTKNRLNELERQGEIKLQLATENVYVQLAMVYYALVQQQKLDEVLKYSLGISRFRLDLAEKKFRLGAASEIDRIQASLDFSNDSSLLLNQETKIVNLKADINRLVGRLPHIPFSVGTEIELTSGLVYSDLENSLLEQNRLLLLAKANVQIKELELKETRSNYLPVLSLYSDYDYFRSENSAGATKSNQSTGPTIGLRLGYNVFNGFNDSRKRQLGKIEYQSAQLEAESELNSIHADLYQNYNDYSSGIKQIALESENLENARKNFQFAIELYKQGSIDEIDFREIQRKEFDAESRLLYAQYNAKMAEIQLLQISGGLKF
jgi:outer membrane protein